jgi:large subunit ribosomal protein L22
MASTAHLKNNRHTPRKMRLVADLVKGKSVEDAVLILKHLPKRAALTLKKLIESAVANAQGASIPHLIVQDVRVDKGIVMKRSMPRARGSAAPIKKRMSHVTVTLHDTSAQKALVSKNTKPKVKA